MRVTQSMLSNNMLRNLSSSYGKMGTIQDQLNTGKKITRPSQDPVIAMKGIGYRSDLNRVEQYQRNLGEANNWLDTTDSTLDGVGQILHRVKELTVDAANGSKNPEDRKAIAKEVEQLQKQLQNMANTKVGDKYIFSGTKTNTPLYDENGVFLAEPGVKEPVNIELSDGIVVKVNTNGEKIFSDLDQMMGELHTALTTPDAPVDNFLTELDTNLNLVLEERADLGARQNRVEMMENRLDTKSVIVAKQLSDNEDVNYAEAITQLITQESIHRAGLSVGSRIIQPSLVDFLR